jgi:3-phenylpropionate/trans-cinnamate dioxygenase ferredoxin reductase subunit
MAGTVVVVGAGLAGGAAATALRDREYDGRVVLIGDEAHPPYERPPLSKELLRGEITDESVLVHPANRYAERQIELRTGTRVAELDAGGPAVVLDDGERVAADAVILAPGGRPRLLGSGPSERLRYLRTIEDAQAIRGFFGPGRRLVVVGAGFIGTEVAASARRLGTDVVVVDPNEVPLEGALGTEAGRVIAALHRDHGVELRLRESVEALEDSAGGVAVRTSSGGVVEGTAAVVGVAIDPNVELAERAGLTVDRGIVVDAALRTSAPGVLAVGDVALHHHPYLGPLRVEHFDNALKMGAHAAGVVLGSADPFDDPHWFWSDQYDLNIQYAGVARTWDRVIRRGSLQERDGIAFYLTDGVLRGALGLNRGRDVRRALKLIGARPDPEGLGDEDVDLRRLAPPAAAR